MLYFLAVLAAYLLDQFSKYIVMGMLTPGSSTSVVKGVFHLTLVHNTGAAFGIFKEHPLLFVVIAAAFSLILIIFMIVKRRILSMIEKISLSLILGGTLGNLTDRLRFGYVVDFLDFGVWPVFNVADSCITVGAVLLAWSILTSSGKNK